MSSRSWPGELWESQTETHRLRLRVWVLSLPTVWQQQITENKFDQMAIPSVGEGIHVGTFTRPIRCVRCATTVQFTNDQKLLLWSSRTVYGLERLGASHRVHEAASLALCNLPILSANHDAQIRDPNVGFQKLHPQILTRRRWISNTKSKHWPRKPSPKPCSLALIV